MFDTLKYSKALEAVGVSRQQAEVHVQIMSEILEGELATKQDIHELRLNILETKAEIEKLEYRLIIKLGSVVGAIVSLGIAAAVAIAKLS